MSSWFLYLIFLYGRLYYALWLIVSVVTIGYLVFRSAMFLIAIENSININHPKYIDKAKIELTKLKRTVYFTFAIIIIFNLIPDKDQLLLIWSIPKLTHNETAINLSQKSWNYLDDYLNRKIEELRMKSNEYDSTGK